MGIRKNTPTTEPADNETVDNVAVAAAEQANAEVQAKADESLEKGYIGIVNDPNPNSAYSIQSGPDSPTLVDDDRTRFAQPSAAPLTKENTDG